MLAATAAPGDATITVQGNVSDWQVGQTLVVVTSFYRDSVQDQNEVRTIQAVVGDSITLDAPLAFQHWGCGDSTVPQHVPVLVPCAFYDYVYNHALGAQVLSMPMTPC